jgi:hypothetical protein
MERGSEFAGAWAGWRIGRDGLLYAPAWRRGLDPGEILALPTLHALESHRRRQVAELEARIEELEGLHAAAEEAARRYRRQVQLEARLGLMLERLA